MTTVIRPSLSLWQRPPFAVWRFSVEQYHEMMRKSAYAAAKLPLYWIVNLPERHMEVYDDPSGDDLPSYRRRRDYYPGDEVPMIVFGQQVGVVKVDDVLPPG